MKKFSKIFAALLCLFSPIMFLYGCKGTSHGKTDYEKIYTEFVPVCSIFYDYVPSVSNVLSAERLYSKIVLTLSSVDDIVTIDEAEYNTSSLKYEDQYYWSSYKEATISKTKTALNYTLDMFKEGDFIAFYNEAYQPHYYKRQILSFEIDFVYVKILYQNTILIKNNEGTQLITTQQFNLEFFDYSSTSK